MGALCGKAKNKKAKAAILMVGLDAAGKTTTLKHFKKDN